MLKAVFLKPVFGLSKDRRPAAKKAMSGWLSRRVGVDLHVGDRYVIVGRIPVIVLGLLALSVVAGAVWLVLMTAMSFNG